MPAESRRKVRAGGGGSVNWFRSSVLKERPEGSFWVGHCRCFRRYRKEMEDISGKRMQTA